ncbi:MAG: Smr/MutS family protein [Deltaproteobacteria bacterium]|nr:Smr/MutS family protein [Deltaproteobacteria bacterium]
MPAERSFERELPDEPAAIPIDGTLDLHHFRPAEVGDVVDAYLDECREKGIRHVRLIHGKGKGVLRRTVHARLERRDDVRSFGLATDRSSWGATLVELDVPDDSV